MKKNNYEKIRNKLLKYEKVSLDEVNENDVDGLAFIFSLSSSQQSVEWATANKVGSEIHVDNSKLAELEGYDTNETSNSDKQLKKYN